MPTDRTVLLSGKNKLALMGLCPKPRRAGAPGGRGLRYRVYDFHLLTISFQGITGPAFDATARASAKHNVILAIQDTTTLPIPRPPQKIARK